MPGTTNQAAVREKARHGDIFLPVNSYHCLVPVTYRELALHWHEEMEITLIREGTSDYRVGQEPFRAEAQTAWSFIWICSGRRDRTCRPPNI